MKRYQFSLATVLRARRAHEDLARADLMRAHQSAARAAAAVAESRAHYAAASSAAAGAEFRAHRELWVLAGQAVTGSENTEGESRAGVAAATERFLAASQAVSALEHLDDRQRQEHAAQTQREEVAVIDDLVTSRHFRRGDLNRHFLAISGEGGPADGAEAAE